MSFFYGVSRIFLFTNEKKKSFIVCVCYFHLYRSLFIIYMPHGWVNSMIAFDEVLHLMIFYQTCLGLPLSCKDKKKHFPLICWTYIHVIRLSLKKLQGTCKNAIFFYARELITRLSCAKRSIVLLWFPSHLPPFNAHILKDFNAFFLFFTFFVS